MFDNRNISIIWTATILFFRLEYCLKGVFYICITALPLRMLDKGRNSKRNFLAFGAFNITQFKSSGD